MLSLELGFGVVDEEGTSVLDVLDDGVLDIDGDGNGAGLVEGGSDMKLVEAGVCVDSTCDGVKLGVGADDVVGGLFTGTAVIDRGERLHRIWKSKAR